MSSKTSSSANGSPFPTVAIIGTGFAGICTAVQLKRQLGIDSFIVFEKGPEVGGTWRENTYPGAACDVPSHLYSFSFETKPDWSRKYSTQPEILEYLQNVAKKYDVYPHVRFSTEVVSATWDESIEAWRLRSKNTRTNVELEEVFNVIVSGVGQLHRPQVPYDVEKFQGHHFHSAHWDSNYDFKNKTIAVVGTGPSSIQFVPEVATQVSKLYLYQRSPGWLVPRLDYAYPEFVKTIFKYVPFVATIYRYYLYLYFEKNFLAFKNGFSATISKAIQDMSISYMKKAIEDPELIKKLIPDYPVGCKRLLISDNWYDTLARENVEVVVEPILEITKTGIRTTAGERDVDCIVFGTGFKSLQFLAPMEIYGRNNVSLQKKWEEGAEAYYGLNVTGFPNLFILYGPNTNLGHNSIIFMLECQVNYTLEMIKTMIYNNVKSLELTPTAHSEFNATLQNELSQTVFAADCNSWYKTKSGKITNNWSNFTVSYWYNTRHPVLENYTPKVRSPQSRLRKALPALLIGGTVLVACYLKNEDTFLGNMTKQAVLHAQILLSKVWPW
eukprot:TRINITY_DN2164_c0_g1_i1.p1 TRINITY_DN2164_c0_g1~~TRINITY_DN2164_c0_g1_i1.p1  ORF type:complete len:555 (+),score=129.10 TRINITY_DN2164_c0_g1_i1:68-1732(+)